jgi:hypothetical protein
MKKMHDASLIIIVANSNRCGVVSTAADTINASSLRIPWRFSKRYSSVLPPKRNMRFITFCAVNDGVIRRKGVIIKGYPGGKFAVGFPNMSQ